MKLRKDKTNTTVYEAMTETLTHPRIIRLFDTCDPSRLKTHRTGFDIDYMSAEHRLNQFFITNWALTIPHLDRHHGAVEAKSIQERMNKIFGCRGLAYNTKNSYQCHHPLCPLCFHRKHYRTINDLKPYLKDTSDMYLIFEHKKVPFDHIDMAMESMEQRAKKITQQLSPHVEQWSRQAHLSYDTESLIYTVSYIVVAVGRKAKADAINETMKKHKPVDAKIYCKKAIMDNMKPLLLTKLYYDPDLISNKAMIQWEHKPPGFKYRAKHTHKRK